jgi:hypothetical protein
MAPLGPEGGWKWFFGHNFESIQFFFVLFSTYGLFEYSFLFVNKQRMIMPNFSSLPATQTDLDKFLTFFQEHLRVLQENS